MFSPFRPRRTHCYLFAHVAKCGGTTLVEMFGRWGRGGICLAEPTSSRAAIVAEARNTIARRKLPRERVELFYGHRVHYGLHELSSLPPRYFTFLRDPLTRVVSLYNHHCGIADDPRHRHHLRDRQVMGTAEARLPFMEWLQTVYTGNHMVRFLAFAADGEDPAMPGEIGDAELQRALRFLDRCWFVGMTESSAVDLPFVCKAMGLKPPRARANVSRVFQHPGDPVISEAVAAKDALDIQLHRYARALRERGSIEPIPALAAQASPTAGVRFSEGDR